MSKRTNKTQSLYCTIDSVIIDYNDLHMSIRLKPYQWDFKHLDSVNKIDPKFSISVCAAMTLLIIC